MPCAVLAQVTSSGVTSVPTTVTLGFESVSLPRGERMGMTSSSLLFVIGRDWALGPAVYGAGSGQRGGFFVGGVELQRLWSLSPGVSLATGIYVGGGGGAAAPVGDGLMLRSSVTLLKDLGPSFQLGLSWSSIRFPGGQIASDQLGLVAVWRNEFVHLEGAHGDPVPPLSQATGLGFDRMSASVSRYRLGSAGGRRIGLAGARAERRSNVDGLTWGLEAGAAAQGDAAGYMELLGTTGFSIAPLASAWPAWRVGLRAGAGLAGGGAVPTGGGAVAKVSGTTEWRVAPGWTVGSEFGWVRSADGSLRARQVQFWLGIDLEPGVDGLGYASGHVVRTEWVGALQHHARIERRDGARASLDTIGLELNRYLDEHVYLSGQAHSAFAGGVGGYSVGMVGAGLATSPTARWRTGIEALLGAAGGGGVVTSGGAIAQTVGWASWAPAAGRELRAGLGITRTLRSGFTSPVVELSWSQAFGMMGR